jgi:prepilin-type processing-associated H-X9-DG protein
LDQRPEAYRCPLVKDNTHTAFQAVVGYQTAWPFHHNAGWMSIADGASNTIHLVESHDPTVEWTSNKDIPWSVAAKGPPPAMHNSGNSKSRNVVMADGSVHCMPESEMPNTHGGGLPGVAPRQMAR